MTKYSLRGALEITTLVNELSSETNQTVEAMREEKEWAEMTLETLDIELKIEKKLFDEF
jgi:hypothetical protein